MRKLGMSLACLVGFAGLAVAAEVTLIKYDVEKKEVTVKDGETLKSYRLTDRSKVVVLRDGKPENATVDTAIKLFSNDKAKGKLKFELTTENGSIVELKLRPKKGK